MWTVFRCVAAVVSGGLLAGAGATVSSQHNVDDLWEVIMKATISDLAARNDRMAVDSSDMLDLLWPKCALETNNSSLPSTLSSPSSTLSSLRSMPCTHGPLADHVASMATASAQDRIRKIQHTHAIAASKDQGPPLKQGPQVTAETASAVPHRRLGTQCAAPDGPRLFVDGVGRFTEDVLIGNRSVSQGLSNNTAAISALNAENNAHSIDIAANMAAISALATENSTNSGLQATTCSLSGSGDTVSGSTTSTTTAGHAVCLPTFTQLGTNNDGSASDTVKCEASVSGNTWTLTSKAEYGCRGHILSLYCLDFV